MTLIAFVVGAELARWNARQRQVNHVVRQPVAAGITWPVPPTFSLDGVDGREIVVHVNPVGEVFEYPVIDGWDIESIAKTLGEIQTL